MLVRAQPYRSGDIQGSCLSMLEQQLSLISKLQTPMPQCVLTLAFFHLSMGLLERDTGVAGSGTHGAELEGVLPCILSQSSATILPQPSSFRLIEDVAS